ncbi:MAG: glucosamine-6-phosphate deaminase [Arenicellales bacterium]
MKVVIVASPEAVAQRGAEIFNKQLTLKPASVLGLATGSTPIALYKNLIALNQQQALSFKQASTFNLDEYLGLAPTHAQSYRYFMQENLFDHIDILLGNTHFPEGNSDDPIAACEEYERLMAQAGGIDLQLLGIGRNGHIGFNEPSSSLASRTRVKTLTRETIDDNARFFAKDGFQPELSITMGIGTIMESNEVVLLATGESKAEAIHDTVEGAVSAACPASILQMHPKVTVVIDEAAASKLSHGQFYKDVEVLDLKLRQKLLSR